MSLPPVWVVNLDRDPNRWTHISKQLDAFDVQYERIHAVDGQSLSDEQIALYSEKEALRLIGRSLSRNEVGCALSHLHCYRRMVNQEIPEVLILEDDVELHTDFWRILHNRNHFPADFDHINFLTDVKQFPFGEPILDPYRMTRFYWRVPTNRTAAYLIRLSGAQKLLRAAYPIRMPADDLTGRVRLTGLKSFGVQPDLASLRDEPSSIWIADCGFEIRHRYGRWAMLSLRIRRNAIALFHVIIRRVRSGK